MRESLRSLQHNLDQALRGRPDVVRLTAAVFLAGGHLLLEDVPGVGKTTLARALAHSVGGTMGRIQFTPDLMPADLTGVTVYRAESGEFVFHPGPVFASVVVADEINRASPKTQSALLEAMQEGQVTVDGTSHALPSPFMVIATQNPFEMAGTYPLPEAQRDRFMARTAIGYPDSSDEFMVLRSGGWDPVATPQILDIDAAQALLAQAAEQHVADRVHTYVLDLIRSTRSHPQVLLGASPRAGLHLIALSRAWALLAGRDHVLPDDVQAVAIAGLGHRITLTKAAQLHGANPESLLAEILTEVPVP